jgi:DNA-binding PadR family transcriptional regulator
LNVDLLDGRVERTCAYVGLGGHGRWGDGDRGDGEGSHTVRPAELDYAIMALIGQGSDYGYSLMNRMAPTFVPFGIDPPSQRGKIYQALDRLEAAGSIERVDGASAELEQPKLRQPRTRYRLTPRGRHRLGDFVVAPMPVAPSRVEFVVRLLCASQTDVEKLTAFLDGWEAACLKHVEQMEPPIIPTGGDVFPALVGKLIDQAFHGAIQAQLDWIELARAALASLAGHRPSPRSR